MQKVKETTTQSEGGCISVDCGAAQQIYSEIKEELIPSSHRTLLVFADCLSRKLLKLIMAHDSWAKG